MNTINSAGQTDGGDSGMRASECGKELAPGGYRGGLPDSDADPRRV